MSEWEEVTSHMAGKENQQGCGSKSAVGPKAGNTCE